MLLIRVTCPLIPFIVALWFVCQDLLDIVLFCAHDLLNLVFKLRPELQIVGGALSDTCAVMRCHLHFHG